MPPHDGTYANTFVNDPLVYTVNTTGTTINANNIYDTYTVDALPWTTTNIRWGREYDHDELKVEVDAEVDRRLEHYLKKMYEIIHEICNFSISEDEFMKLLKED